METIKKPSITRPLPLLTDLSQDSFNTQVMKRDRTLRRLLSQIPGRESEAGGAPTQIKLMVRGIPECVTLNEQQVILLGRADFRSRGFQPDLDLTRYGAHERGVSRAHARLHLQDGKLYITDLYSANGTFLRGNRLTPEQPIEINDGDDLSLGALSIRVLFA
jgi:hypothetical protein